MNYVILKHFQGHPCLGFIKDTYCTQSYKTYLYHIKTKDETKIHEVKALEMLNPGRNHVLESLSHEEYWTVNKLVQLLESKEDSCFIMYADIDYERAWSMYTDSFLENRDIPIHSIIRVDP